MAFQVSNLQCGTLLLQHRVAIIVHKRKIMQSINLLQTWTVTNACLRLDYLWASRTQWQFIIYARFILARRWPLSIHLWPFDIIKRQCVLHIRRRLNQNLVGRNLHLQLLFCFLFVCLFVCWFFLFLVGVMTS